MPDRLPDRIDMRILDALQDDLPLLARPYAEIARRLGMSETDLLTRLKRLQEAGIIRGIAPVLESRYMGLAAATLIAVHVPEEKVREAAAIISRYPEVSHNFLRDHHYSLWFTLSARSKEQIGHVLDEILGRTGISREDVLDLPTVKKLKIDVRFPFLPPGNEEDALGSP
jgi:DNA-binding Lrp family transcriptional regulator